MLRAVRRVVAVDLGVEGLGDARGGAAEGDPVAPAGDVMNREALLLQPAGDLAGVVAAQAEAVGKLFGGEPAVVVRGRRVLLVCEKRFETGRGLQIEGSVIDAEGRVCRAPIVSRAGLRALLAWQDAGSSGYGPGGDTVCGRK